MDLHLSFEGPPARGAREVTLEGVFILAVEKVEIPVQMTFGVGF